MATTIISNGSKWAGEAPDSIEVLLETLASNPLNRTFEDFIERRENGSVRFFGNFLTVSHVFCIDTDDSEVIAALTDAILANQKRADYTAQPSHEQQLAAEVEYWHARHAVKAKG